MITVKFLGGAKKSFQRDDLVIKKNSITISELMIHLLEIKPKDTNEFDVNNLLVAINGVDSSALDGKNTIIKENDVVSIIPIIHGGSKKRTQFRIGNTLVELFEIKNHNKLDDKFLIELRRNHPKIIIQGISSKYLLNLSHVKKILQISISAQKNDDMLSDKIETDLLLRFTITTQINDAIRRGGIKNNDDFFIIAIGKDTSLDSLYLAINHLLKNKTFTNNNSSFLKKEFKISNDNLRAVLSDTPLEDILAEKAAVLF